MSTKQIGLNLVIASLAFVVGVGVSRLYHPAMRTVTTARPTTPVCEMPNNLQPIVNVHFCDLMEDPERYDGRLVRFEAFMLADSGYEPSNDHVYVGHTRCTPTLWVNDGFHLASRTCPAVLRRLDSLLMRYDPSYPRKNAKVTVVGIFSSPKESTRSGKWQSERFTIISVERAASVDENN